MTTRAAGLPRPLFRKIAAILAAAGTALLAACETFGASEMPPVAPRVGLYELRIYTPAPGKLDALDARFRDHTVDLFLRHGMTPIGFFHPVAPPGGQADNHFYYLLGYKDRAARDASWAAFANDPEWKKAYADSEANGPLLAKMPENIFLTATDYSPRLNTTPSKTPRLFELRTYTTNPGKLEDLHARFRNHTLSIFAKHGMTSLLYWRPVDGQPSMNNKMVYLLAFPNQAARDADWMAFSADEEWKQVSAASNKDGPILVSPGGVVSVQLSPTDYSPLR